MTAPDAASSTARHPLRPDAALAAHFAALGRQVSELCARHDHAQALRVAKQALALAPGHPAVLGDMALCLMRLARVDEACKSYSRALAADPDNANLHDGMAEACGMAGRATDARSHGRRALTLKAAEVAARPAWPLPAGMPAPFDAGRRARNIVSYSLFGANPRYCETAVLNVREAHRLLPGWTCRFHCDESVPQTLLRRLLDEGAQVVRMAADLAQNASGLMWRFMVLDDPAIDRFLLRDADSLISTREAGAVAAWLDSGRWFHLMRDGFTHSELLLAGMWGGCGGVFRGVRQSLIDATRTPPRLGARLIDQHWLRAHAWPTVRQSVLAHDPVFGFDGGLPFPDHPPTGWGASFRVGDNLANTWIGGAVALADATPLVWTLRDAGGLAVCSYRALSQGGQWRAAVPRPYAQALEQGRWRCEVRLADPE